MQSWLGYLLYLEEHLFEEFFEGLPEPEDGIPCAQARSQHQRRALLSLSTGRVAQWS